MSRHSWLKLVQKNSDLWPSQKSEISVWWALNTGQNFVWNQVAALITEQPQSL